MNITQWLGEYKLERHPSWTQQAWKSPEDPLALCKTANSCFLPSLVYAARFFEFSLPAKFCSNTVIIHSSIHKLISKCILVFLTANSNVARFNFGWTSNALIRGKGYTASPPCWDRMRGMSTDSIAVEQESNKIWVHLISHIMTMNITEYLPTIFFKVSWYKCLLL